MTTRKTSTGHTLTHRLSQPLWLHVGGQAETIDTIPDAEIVAFARSLGLAWSGEIVDESTLLLEIPEGAVSALRREAAEAGDMEQVAICDAAIEGDAEAAIDCARVIAEAAAQEVRS